MGDVLFLAILALSAGALLLFIRACAGFQGASVEQYVIAAIALGLLAYLFYALIKPEKFQGDLA